MLIHDPYRSVQLKKQPSAPEWVGRSSLKLGQLYLDRFPDQQHFVGMFASPVLRNSP